MGDIDIKTFLQAKREKEAKRDTEYRRDSKQRLEKILETKIKTTMIGALDSIEKNLGFLWEADEKGVYSDEALFLKEIFQKVRTEILDRGNHQIKSMMAELKQYDVEWLRYQITLLPKNINDEEQNGKE